MIENAKITSTKLGYEDHGIFTVMIFVDLASGGSCGIGGVTLDTFDRVSNSRKLVGDSAEVISNILKTVGVDNWEDLPGKFLRVDSNGWGGHITKIGNLMDDVWFDFDAIRSSVYHSSDKTVPPVTQVMAAPIIEPNLIG